MRRLFVALLLSLPIAIAGLTAGAPARADDTGAPTYLVMGVGPDFTYGSPADVRVWMVAEEVAPRGDVVLVVDGEQVASISLVVDPPGSNISTAVGKLPVLEPGNHEIRVEYAGSDALAPSSDTRQVRIHQAEPALSLAPSDQTSWAGAEVTFTARVAPVAGSMPGTALPTGSITFVDETLDRELAVVPVTADGTATLVTDDLTAGSVTMSATYAGDARFTPEQVGASHYVRKVPTTTELTASDTTPTYGDDLRLVARVRSDVPDRGAPTGGIVEFVVDNKTIARVPATPVEGPSDGVSSLAILERSDIPAGSHWVTARYRDSAGFEKSDARGVEVRVARRATRTVASPVFLGVHPFVLPNAVLRATVTASSTGQPVAGVPVTFTAGKTSLCTAQTDAAGVATCDAAAQRLALTLNGGYVAAFAGDADNLASSARGNLVG